MKKIIAITLAMLTLLAIPTAALADGSTTFTATVPDAQYTLNIPADQEIPFGQIETNIGNVTVTDSSGFAVGKNLKVTVDGIGFVDGMGMFTCEGSDATIPFYLGWNVCDEEGNIEVGGSFFGACFFGQEDGTVRETFDVGGSEGEYAVVDYIDIYISNEAWSEAAEGEYSTTLTFSSEVEWDTTE